MSTLEKLFVQIFDRKNWIIDQLKQQSDSYDQYLASTLLINGIRPPSWLWSAGFETGSSDLKGSKKEELISGLLFPPPRSKVPSSIDYNTFYNRPSIVATNVQMLDGLLSETCASNKFLDVENRSTVVPRFHPSGSELEVGCALEGVPEQDHTITSPQHHMDVRMADTCCEADHSLARIQRSRSRQKALELRNSAKEESRKRRRQESCSGVYSGRLTRSRMVSEQPQHITDLLKGGGTAACSSSSAQQINASDKSSHLLQALNYAERDAVQDAQDTQVITQRSRSGQKRPDICDFVGVCTEKNPTKEDTVNDYSGKINCAKESIRSGNSSKIPSCGKVTQPTSVNTSYQHADPLNLVEGHDPMVSDALNLAHEERSSVEPAETKLASNIQVEDNRVCSRSSMVGASLGVGFEFLFCTPPADSSIFVEPKQLIFDDIEDCSFNKGFKPTLGEENWDQFPEMRCSSFVSTESLVKAPDCINLHEECDPSSSKQLLEKDQKLETFSKKEKLRNSFETHEEKLKIVCREKSEGGLYVTSARKTSNIHTPSSREGPEEVFGNARAGRSLETSKISMQENDSVAEVVDTLSDRSPESNKFSMQEKENIVEMVDSLSDRSPENNKISVQEKDSIVKVVDALSDRSPESNKTLMQEKDSIVEVVDALFDRSPEGNKISTQENDSIVEVVDTLSVRSPESSKISIQQKDSIVEAMDALSDKSPEGDKISTQEMDSIVEAMDALSDKSPEGDKISTQEKDSIVEVVGTVEELGAYSGAHAEERLQFAHRDKFEYSVHPTSKEGLYNTSDVVVYASPESNKISNCAPDQLVEEVTVSNCIHEKCACSLNGELLHRDQTAEVLNREEERRVFYSGLELERLESLEVEKSGSHFCPPTSTDRISNVCNLFSRNISSNIDGEIVSDKSLEVDKLSTSALRFGRNGSFESELQGAVEISLPDVGSNAQAESFDNYTGKLDMEFSKILPEDSKLDIDAGDGPKKSMEIDFNSETCFSLLKKPDTLLEAHETEPCYAFVTNDANNTILRQTVTPGMAKVQSTEKDSFLTSYTRHEIDVGCSASDGSSSANKSIHPIIAINSSWESTWPQCKRRKVENLSSNVLTTSPRLRKVKPPQNEGGICRSSRRPEVELGTVLEFQHIPVSCDMEVSQTCFIENPAVDMCGSAESHRFQYSPKLQINEHAARWEQGDHDANINLRSKESVLESPLGPSVRKEGDIQSCFKDELGMADPSSIVHDHKMQCHSEDEQNLKSGYLEGRLFSHYSASSASCLDLDPIGAAQTKPELERFNIGASTENILSCMADGRIVFDELDLPSTSSERISVLEKLCRSTSMLTPLVHTSEYKLQRTPDIYQSMPNGLLEHMEPSNSVSLHSNDIRQLMDTYNEVAAEFDRNFPVRSYSDCKSSSSDQSDWNGWRPYTPPVVKSCQKLISVSGGQTSQKQQGLDRKLTCYRIDEDTCNSEEGGKPDKPVEPFHEAFSSLEKNSALYRQPLVDMTNVKSPAVSDSEDFSEIGNLDSVITELNFSGIQVVASPKTENGRNTDRKSKNKGKENQSFSIGGKAARKVSGSLNNRVSQPKLSRKTIDRKGSQAFEDKGCKVTNIVSNISSFVPLVQQKHQQPAILTGKRDIKVKALEAAEALKRIEEKKENDRKMKKEAAILERARLEQEKLKQLELKQKEKEEVAKRKEANVALRKKLREEEEEKKKERKRTCIEETRKQHKEQKNLRAEKEEKVQRGRTTNGTRSKRTMLPDEVRKQGKGEKEKERADSRERMETDVRTSEVSAGKTKKASDVHKYFETLNQSDGFEKVASKLDKANEVGVSVTGGSLEQPYEISPYQNSGGEEDEYEDDAPNRKFIPSWARGKHLAPILCSLQQINPYEIFPPESFCSIAEVLLPPKNSK